MLTTINRKKTPGLKEIGAIKIQEAKKSNLDNGIPVYSINAGFQDLVKVELLFQNAAFNVSQPLVNSATNRLLSDGSSKHTSHELAEMIDHYGAFYETEESFDSCSVILFTLNKYLDATLPVFREILTDAIFPESELVTFVQNNSQRLMVESEKVNAVARKKFNETVFGPAHPYGYYIKPEDYHELKREQIKNHYLANYGSSNCTILIAGSVNDETIESVNKFFGKDKWEGKTIPGHPAVSIEPAKEKKLVVEKKGAVQSAIRIGKVLFNKSHPDYIGMSILNTALGGYFGSRLMNNIREDKGYTYSIGSAVMSMKETGCFFISTEVGADVTSKAIDEIYKEVERLRVEPIKNNELQMVKNFMTGSFLKGIDGAFPLSDRWKGLWTNGLSYDYYYTYLEKIRTIQPAELMELAQKYLDYSTFYEVVVGKK